MRLLNPYAPEWTPAAMRARAGIELKAEVNKVNDITFDLAGLPAEVVTLVVSFLTNPRDLVSCICACKFLKGHVHDAELVLDIRSWRTSSGHGNGGNIECIFDNKPKALLGLSKHMPGTVALVLPNLSLEDCDLNYLRAMLPRLQMLDMSGARKITHTGVSALTRPTTGALSLSIESPILASSPAADNGPKFITANPESGRTPDSSLMLISAPPRSLLPPLRFANLQRCFQLHAGSLDELLAAPGLRGLALSHLDLGRWPLSPGSGLGPDVSTCPGLPTKTTGLQVLALNNCLRLHGAAIDALVAACGGEQRGRGPGGHGNYINTSTSSFRFLLLGGSTLALSAFVNSSCRPPDLPPHLNELLTSAYKPTLTSTATTTQAHLAAARHLLAAVLSLPRLVALELTFFPQPLVQCLRRVLSDREALGNREPVQIWDFAAADGTDVDVARRTLRRVLYRSRLGVPGAEVEGMIGSCSWTTGPGVGTPLPGLIVSSRAGEVLDQCAVATVLRCVINCSSVTRSTPLHLAAERGNAGVVAQLLAAGSVVDARDTAGSTALFLASEAGHTAAVERLLAAGADPSLSNAAGETPLYIAALRGHLGCVKELLVYCNARGIAWQDPEMYGDAWTPLHAAAVANRADVAAYLLQAAGSAGAGELVLAPNKYGQSVLHVAARKGSSQLLRLLLSAGGVAVVGSRDGSGDTPVDVAKKNRHVAALAEFRRLTGGHTATRGPQAAATAMA
ncbi:hypothetical protein Vretimale_9982 [Volvox reticuliferus]|uniref:F-box domain-containing protein n=1 Tax=Volvox reticuliferus TaxID=1737510 RepID=A0A8J4CRA7_9CHLO|nr:hypothetical protein Vretifemale_13754 [Volvox reticuliferus]GIM05498.1 hypothetical protein Vretimale_9982 [Volvox reticuliferus]